MALRVNGSTHLIPALLLIYRPRKDERLSWPSWLTCSGWFTHGWFTHISGHLSATGRAQDRESSPVRDQHSTTVLRQQRYFSRTTRHSQLQRTKEIWKIKSNNYLTISRSSGLRVHLIFLQIPRLYLSFDERITGLCTSSHHPALTVSMLKLLHTYNSSFCVTTWVSQCQKGKTNLNFTEASK